jgi:hypothetical protein
MGARANGKAVTGLRKEEDARSELLNMLSGRDIVYKCIDYNKIPSTHMAYIPITTTYYGDFTYFIQCGTFYKRPIN